MDKSLMILWISNVDDAIDTVWDMYNIQKIPNRKRGKFLNRLIYEDVRK